MQGGGSQPSWGASAVYDGGAWHWLVGAKTNAASGASDFFAENSGMLRLRSDGGVGGPFNSPSEQLIGGNGLVTEGPSGGDGRSWPGCSRPSAAPAT